MSADEMAAGAGGPSHFRALHADREQAVNALKAAFVQGRLGKDDFDLRVGRVLTARTFADLDAVTADIRAGVTKAQPLASPREPRDKKLVVRASVVAALVVSSVAVPLLRFPGVVGLITGAIHGCLVGALLAALLRFHSWVLGRSSRHSS